MLASSLVAEVSGTLTLLSVSTPFSLAVFTASLVVALLMLALALFASALASVVNLAFSSSVKLDLLISSIFLAKASSIALLASSLVAEVVASPSKASTAPFTDLVRAFTWSAESFAPVAARTA